MALDEQVNMVITHWNWNLYNQIFTNLENIINFFYINLSLGMTFSLKTKLKIRLILPLVLVILVNFDFSPYTKQL